MVVYDSQDKQRVMYDSQDKQTVAYVSLHRQKKKIARETYDSQDRGSHVTEGHT